MRLSSDVSVNAKGSDARKNLMRFTGTGERKKQKKIKEKQAQDPVPGDSILRSVSPEIYGLLSGTGRYQYSNREAQNYWRSVVEQRARDLTLNQNVPIEDARRIAASNLLSSGITPSALASMQESEYGSAPFNVADIFSRESALREPGAAALTGVLRSTGVDPTTAEGVGGAAGLVNSLLASGLGYTNKFPTLSRILNLAEENPLLSKLRTGQWMPTSRTVSRSGGRGLKGFGGKLLAAEMALRAASDPRGSWGIVDELYGDDPTTYKKLQNQLARRNAYKMLRSLNEGGKVPIGLGRLPGSDSVPFVRDVIGGGYNRSRLSDALTSSAMIPAIPADYLDKIFTGGLGGSILNIAGLPTPENITDVSQAAVGRQAARSMGAQIDPFEQEKRQIRSILRGKQTAESENFVRSLKKTLSLIPPESEEYKRTKSWLNSIQSGDQAADPTSNRFSAGFEMGTPELGGKEKGKGSWLEDALLLAGGVQTAIPTAYGKIFGVSESSRPQLERAQAIRRDHYQRTGKYMPMHEAYRMAETQEAPVAQPSAQVDPTKSVWQSNLQQASGADSPVNMLKSQSNWYRNFYDRTTSGTGDYNYWRSLSSRFDTPEQFNRYVTPEVIEGIKGTSAYKDVMKGLGGQWSKSQIGTFLHNKKPYELKSLYGGTRKDILDKYTKGRRLSVMPTKYYDE